MNLPSIKNASHIDTRDITPQIRMIFASYSRPVLHVTPGHIPLHGDNALQVTYDDSKRQWNTQLTLTTERKAPLAPHPAFIVELRDGSRHLIGAAEPPYPIVKHTHTTGANPTQTHQHTYTITWPHPPIPVTTWMPGDITRPITPDLKTNN